MIKAVQMSDVHLGFQYNRLPEKSAKIRRQELMQTFRKGLQFAQTQQVDFLLMPGDIFDNPKPERSLVQDVRDALADIAPIRVMIAAGNHDYAYPGSVWLEFARRLTDVAATLFRALESTEYGSAWDSKTYLKAFEDW